jgi:hypothetical protein
MNASECRQNRNGLELWRMLRGEFEPRTGSRRTLLLLQVLQPKMSSSDADDLWRSRYESWLTLVQEYEALAGEQLQETIRCALVMSTCPAELLPLVQSRPDLQSSFNLLDATIKQFLQARRRFDDGAMEVDRVDGRGGAAGACWNCGSTQHQARNCPKGKGKGGKKGRDVPGGGGHGSGGGGNNCGGGGHGFGGNNGGHGGGSSSAASSFGGSGSSSSFGLHGRGPGSSLVGGTKGKGKGKGGKGRGKGGKSSKGKGGKKGVRALEEETGDDGEWVGDTSYVESWNEDEDTNKSEAAVEQIQTAACASGTNAGAGTAGQNDLWVW